MAQIGININTIRSANYNLPGIASKVEIPKRNLGILKWRIPEEVSSRYDIKKRLEDVYKDMDTIERKIDELYSVTNSCISQYEAVERDNTRNAEAFL